MRDEESGKWMDASYEIRVVSYEDTSYTLRVSVCTCLRAPCFQIYALRRFQVELLHRVRWDC